MATLDEMMADANGGKAASYAARPVIPNAPAPDLGDQGDMTNEQIIAGGAPSAGLFGVPGADVTLGAPPAGPSGLTRARYALFPSTASDRANAGIAPDALAPRTADYGDQVDRGLANGRLAAANLPSGGPLATAVSVGVPQSVPVPYSVTPYGGAQTGAAPAAVPGYKADYAAMQASDAANAQSRDNRQLGQAAAANAQQDLTRLQGEQRVARFNAQNGADVILGSELDKDRGYAAAAKNLAGVDADVATAQGRLSAGNVAQIGTRNYIDEFGKSEEAKTTAAKAAAGIGLTNVETQGKQLGIEQEKQANALIKQLADPNLDPKLRGRLEQSYLVMRGKDPNRYQVEHSNGPPVPDAFGGLHPGAQYVHVIDRWDPSNVQTIRADAAPGGAPTGPKPELDAFLKQAKAANPAMSIDQLTKIYGEKYGAAK